MIGYLFGAYPRAGGGTSRTVPGVWGLQGLSPRRRGNLRLERRDQLRLGPIPAQAGEPHRLILAVRAGWAYPRAGGGTCTARSHLRS